MNIIRLSKNIMRKKEMYMKYEGLFTYLLPYYYNNNKNI